MYRAVWCGAMWWCTILDSCLLSSTRTYYCGGLGQSHRHSSSPVVTALSTAHKHNNNYTVLQLYTAKTVNYNIIQ